MGHIDDIEDMIGEEELSRSAMESSRAPMVVPKAQVSADGPGDGGSDDEDESGSAADDAGMAGNAASDATRTGHRAGVPGTQKIW
ncbi:hypothetical protein PINS_up001191 [Pythium insidiosum]|nr:hypothetical protein PINS_up001191 [Pythium insidiosum]